jgi:hypothetical protein
VLCWPGAGHGVVRRWSLYWAEVNRLQHVAGDPPERLKRVPSPRSGDLKGRIDAIYASFCGDVLSCVPTRCFAQSSFDGTWRKNIDESQLPQEPSVILLDKGFMNVSVARHLFEEGLTGRTNP